MDKATAGLYLYRIDNLLCNCRQVRRGSSFTRRGEHNTAIPADVIEKLAGVVTTLRAICKAEQTNVQPGFERWCEKLLNDASPTKTGAPVSRHQHIFHCAHALTTSVGLLIVLWLGLEVVCSAHLHYCSTLLILIAYLPATGGYMRSQQDRLREDSWMFARIRSSKSA